MIARCMVHVFGLGGSTCEVCGSERPRPRPCASCDELAETLTHVVASLIAHERLARPLDETALRGALAEVLHEHLPGFLG